MSNKSDSDKYLINLNKNFITPYILLVLKNINLHGYLIMKELANYGFFGIDQGNFYRTLRRLEKDNLISSEWETTEDGPAKRVYTITQLGEEYLIIWAESMKKTQKVLTNFFNLYSTILNPYSNYKEED
ncbi:MAG: poly-beta-hydroxybutyrate-responsive repressor [Bacillales bacterium]|nr:poly-beta-hydroxybutyrate-responsive repressor [Bacillales bacterium]